MSGRRARAGTLAAVLVLGGLTHAAAHAETSGSPLEHVRPDPLATSPERLSVWSALLQDERPERRHAAIEQLRALGAEALPALAVHLRELGRAGADGRSLAPKLAHLRRLQRLSQAPSTAALASALSHDRSPAMRHAVELVSLQYALLAQRTPSAADTLVGELFRLAPNALRSDAVRARKQLGSLLGPAYLRHAGALEPAMRRLCRAALAALGRSTPQRAFERVDPTVLPELLRVYGEQRSAEALPWLVAHVGDLRPAVHAAAREAVTHFDERAAPLLRERYLRLARTPAPTEWEAPRILVELEQRAFAAHEETAARSLERAESALRAGKLTEAGRALDEALRARRGAELGERLAAAHLSLAGRYEAASAKHDALRTYRRAERSRPPPHLAPIAHARVLQLEAELRLADGIVDVHALATAAALDPALTRASDLVQELSGVRRAQVLAYRRYAGIAAAALLTIAAALLLRDAKQRRMRPRMQRNHRVR